MCLPTETAGIKQNNPEKMSFKRHEVIAGISQACEWLCPTQVLYIMYADIIILYNMFLGNQKHSIHYTGPFKGIVWTGIQKIERFVRNELNQFEWFSSQPTHWTKTCLFLTCLVRSEPRTHKRADSMRILSLPKIWR